MQLIINHSFGDTEGVFIVKNHSSGELRVAIISDIKDIMLLATIGSHVYINTIDESELKNEYTLVKRVEKLSVE